jgi:hypothetical protein
VVLETLAAQAERAPRRAGVWKKGRDRILTKRIHGEYWRLGEHDDVASICWVLLVPKVSREGTCGARSRILANAIIVYMGGRPDPNDGRHLTSLVVYGRASGRVRSLAIVLSDCSVLHVDLSSRPLFWVFLSDAKLDAGVHPQQFAAALADRRVIQGPLPDLQPKPHSDPSLAAC